MIIGHSDQSCWQLAVNAQGVVFGKLEAMLPLNYAVGLDKLIHMAMTYNKTEKSLKSYFLSDLKQSSS